MINLTKAYDYAARMHSGQTRKGDKGEPYINHVTDVAHRVSQSSHGTDSVLIIAAILHDVVEDTDCTEADIVAEFGAEVASVVMEVTDDKSLPKAERKRLQVEKVPHKSDRAKRLKLADKASNLTSIATSPPADWDTARKSTYVVWAEAVIAGCKGVDPALEQAFDAAVKLARNSIGDDA